jgi:hypothetical protein
LNGGLALTGRQLLSLDRGRIIALSLPLGVPVAMTATFAVTYHLWGDRLGYIAGFGVYWGVCAALSIGLLGPARIRQLFADSRPRLGRPAAVGAALLLWPAIGAIVTRFIPEVGHATPAMIGTIAIVACINAILEELLWRGVYITFWPHSALLGWIWPAIGFGAWHLAPQVIHPAAMGPVAYVLAATALGLSWGWIAFQTHTIRWTCVSHVVTDGSGLRNALFFLG